MSKATKKTAAVIVAPVEVTTDTPAVANEDPRWLAVKETAGRLRDAGRTWLEIQAWLGWQLAQLKKDHDVTPGRKKNSADSAELTATWPELVQHYCGFSRRTGDVMIQLFEASKAKLKRLAKKPEQKAALALFTSGNPLALAPEDRAKAREAIASLTTGETQASLMVELGVVPKPAMPAKTSDKKDEDDKWTDEELAFHHWDGVAQSIVTARSPEGVKLLHLLPPVASEPGKLCLAFLRDEAAATLAAIEDALAAHKKPGNAA